ncbi:hypothetical protein COCON_G00204040 [Conger conger]|uniref:Trinucleotide repeat-containing gene 18 protein n=1 Tax=Conger conger TaxID=82655 RepID=A0A9Q1HPA9_CONCO|nr:hypothetical protein COCON_G00204040 [Conger conger]
MHLPEATANGLNPNLMVTGGPPLVSSGRWPPDPASHLVSHPWMPRPSAPSMWPYGLGPPSLHQGLPPGYPQTLPGSIPPPYQFARDPQSGQLLVIPTEHLPHYAAELMERSPPLWPSLYPSASSSLQHAQELHLLSQQQLLRQQELLMIQQQAAQVMELQRSAQLAERLKASEHRAEMEEKAAKRSADGGKHGVSARPGPALHSRKPAPPRTPTPTAAYSKALTPLPSPPKTEKSLPVRSYSHPSTPAPRLPSPASAPPPLAAPIPPKEECVDVCENKELDLQNHVSAPLQALYPEIPPGYPYPSLTAPFGSHYPYLLQPAAAADADGLAPDVPLPAETPERSAAPADVKPRRLRSPAAAGPPRPRGEHPTLSGPAVKEEPGLEEVREHPNDPAARLAEMPAPARSCQGEFETGRRSVVVPTPVEGPTVDELADGGRVKLEETALLNCRAPYQGPDADTALPETEPPILEGSTGPEGLTYHPSACSDEPQALVDPASPEPEETEPELDSEQPLEEALEVSEPAPETPSPPPHGLPGLSVTDVALDDPMAGMIALVAASELPQACLLPGSPSDLTPLGCSGLEGMTLLGEVAELELERQHSALLIAGPCGLETLLLASRQVLLEELQRPVVTIRLPRELNPNRRYSWMQKKEEPLFSKSALEGMDMLEVDYRMRLAELQRRYKDRQRELAKLQRRREREEKLLLEESSRASARRGPGRPRKRKHSLAAPSPPAGKLDTRNARFSKSLPLSEDSEAGEILRKRFRGPSLEEDEDMDGAMKVKRKNKQWGDREASSSFSQEMPMKSNKKRRVSEQEQLASKLDRALSLTKLGKLHRSPFQYTEGHYGRATPGSGSCGKFSALREMELKAKAGKQSLSKGLGLFQKSSKGGKNKMAAKTKNMEPCMNVKGQQKALYSPVRSEVSSYSNNTDTEEEEEEEEEEELMEGWPPRPALSRTGARSLRPALCSKASNKSWPLSKRGGASGGLHPQRALGRTTHKHFGLLLREAGASSSEDSFDQGY